MTSLPENAYRELAPGEEYTPMLPASAAPAEVTPYSVGMGIVMAIVFSAAAAYLGLKIGQVFEAAIPIAIIAVGMGSVLGKRNMLGQNVIIQSIGASSGVIVAGAIFTLPALYILGLDAAFYQIFLSSLFGGLLGIVLLIPFRSYFVKEMHGKYPFPEATATTEVLVSGEKGGAQAKLLAVAGAVGGLYDFVVSTFGAWTESVSTRICDFGAMCADKFKVVFGLNTGAAVLGLGYIIGLKYATIITAGSCLVWFLVVPLVGSVIPDAASFILSRYSLHFCQGFEKTGSVSGMAGCTDLLYFSKDRIIVTIQCKGFYKLKMSGCESLRPEFIAASAPVSHFTCFKSGIKCFFIHIRQHQHFICLIILGYNRYHSITV